MTSLTDAMEDLRGRLAGAVTGRSVHVDPTRVADTPCVLIELPQMTPNATLCGGWKWQHTVLVIGQPGAWAELGPLSALLEQLLTALDDLGIGWSLAEPVAYTPLVQAGMGDPCISYRITIEEFS